jgi:hypothetical protein
MTALTKLLDFADTLPNNKGIEFLQLLQGYQKEMIAEKTQLIEGYERIIRGTKDTPQSEVVAVAGTAETLLNDVGEIKYGDVVECIAVCSAPLDCEDDPTLYKGYRIEVEDVFEHYIYLSQGIHSRYKKSDFRKVYTPLSNPLNTVEGC